MKKGKKRMKSNNLFLLTVLFISFVIIAVLIINFTGQVIEGNLKCVDSDNGVNLEIKGTAESSSKTIQTDFCVGSLQLREFHCSGVGISGRVYNCLGGCENGACIKTNVECIDGDNGKDLMKRASVKNITDVKTDRCYDSKKIYEFSCNGSNIITSLENCPNGMICAAGSCKSI